MAPSTNSSSSKAIEKPLKSAMKQTSGTGSKTVRVVAPSDKKKRSASGSPERGGCSSNGIGIGYAFRLARIDWVDDIGNWSFGV
ncbi:hypothetical protein SBOR_8349 [Sclerotinia borealis F-4128]|uniref:Uncharacterized protein n=1 Tax=Sclerotinia borealis (strain F-4128) TaxID=1432307 RepID=W9C5V2_SCLBF|nr:hypothetical protein SBOR_8349 [Sclerotinia borealis F-4128]